MKKHRKLLAAILSLAMILTLVPFALFASAEDEYVPYMNGLVANEEPGNYYIDNALGLRMLATMVNGGNSYAGSNFRLDRGIDLSAYEDWTPIGSAAVSSDSESTTEDSSAPFSGTFDGNGKKVTKMNIGIKNES